jgi:hypothetical protein
VIKGFILFTSTPPGGAPWEIRQKWVGLILPFFNKNAEVLPDVVTGEETSRTGGYSVSWADAMDALEKVSPETAAWWWDSAIAGCNLVFDESCCQELAPVA